MAQLTTTEAAARLGLHQTRIQQFIRQQRLPAQKIGRDWLINEQDLALITVYGKPGRPKKAAVNGAHASAHAQVNGAEQTATVQAEGSASDERTAKAAKAGKGKGRKAAKKSTTKA